MSFKKSKSNPWVADKNSEDLGAVFFDIDSDGDQDLYVTSGGSEFKQGSPLLKDRLYINNGIGSFTKKEQAVPNIFESSQTVKPSDIDNDGDLDLFVGTRLIPGKYTYPASSYILINENGVLKKAATKIAPNLEKIGMVSDAVFSDIDQDGDEDLLIVGEWMTIKVLENTNGQFNDVSIKYGLDVPHVVFGGQLPLMILIMMEMRITSLETWGKTINLRLQKSTLLKSLRMILMGMEPMISS